MTTPRTTTPDFLSPSSVALWQQCPQRWVFRYIRTRHPLEYLRNLDSKTWTQRLLYIVYLMTRTLRSAPTPPTAARIGTTVHKVLEELFTLPPEERTRKRAAAIQRRQWRTNPRPRRDSHTKRSREYKLVKALVANLWEHMDPQTIQVIATEMKLETSLEGHRFIGYTDLVTKDKHGQHWIVEWKTGKIPAKDQRSAAQNQVDFYAAAYTQITGQPAGTTLVYLTGSPSRRGRTVTTPFDQEHIQRAVQQLSTTALEIQVAATSGQYPTKPGTQCGRCNYKSRCPAH